MYPLPLYVREKTSPFVCVMVERLPALYESVTPMPSPSIIDTSAPDVSKVSDYPAAIGESISAGNLLEGAEIVAVGLPVGPRREPESAHHASGNAHLRHARFREAQSVFIAVGSIPGQRRPLRNACQWCS